MQKRLGFGLVMLVLCGLSRPTAAQICHAIAPLAGPTQGEGLGVRAGLATVLGSYDNASGKGDYQGLTASVSLARPDWSGFAAQVSLPMYRLVYQGVSYHGLGDLGASARVAVLRASDSGFAIGPELGATFPTGAEDKSLGMGHTMLMPGAFMTFAVGPWSLLAQLAYGRALVDEDMHAHHHHGGGGSNIVLGPLVDPMNFSELEHALHISYTLHPQLHALVQLVGAVPAFGDGMSATGTRELLGAGLQGLVGAFDASALVQLPLVGDPFSARLWLAIGVHG